MNGKYNFSVCAFPTYLFKLPLVCVFGDGGECVLECMCTLEVEMAYSVTDTRKLLELQD